MVGHMAKACCSMVKRELASQLEADEIIIYFVSQDNNKHCILQHNMKMWTSTLDLSSLTKGCITLC